MILCAGEALIDMLPRDLAEGGSGFAPHAGGAVYNTAIALGRLGTEVAFFSGLSNDMFGAQLRAGLAASKVIDRTARSNRPTTLAFVELVYGHARYAFYDESTAGRMVSVADLPSTHGVDALFLGGISLAVEPCAATYEALALRDGADKLVMVDPNIRPSFIKDEGTFRTRLARMLAVTDVVKLSDEDLDWWNGGDVAAVLAAGPKVVCMTEGSKGVTAHHAGGTVFVPAEAATVVDTVGAGDTFNAGFLAGLSHAGALNKAAMATLSQDTLHTALSLGAKAAAITVSRAGANPPWSDEL